MDHSDSKNKRKFLTCFKPVTEEYDPHSTSPPSFEYDQGGQRRKNKARLRFSGAMKAVLFKVSLVEKLKSKKSRHVSISSTASSSRREKFANSMTRSSSCDRFLDPEDVSHTNSHHSSLFSSNSSATLSSRPSSVSLESRSGSERITRSVSLNFKQINTNNRQQSVIKRDEGKFTSKGMCIIVVCLIAVVFWGKVFAIMTCTSTLLFFAPGHQPQIIDSTVTEVMDSKCCKKRVVMEGLI